MGLLFGFVALTGERLCLLLRNPPSALRPLTSD